MNKLFFVLLAILVSLAASLAGQTILGAGDIAIIGFNTNTTPDNLAILVLKDLTAGTVFYINDNEVLTAGGTTFADINEAEAAFTVKAGQTVLAGTVIVLPWGAAAVDVTAYTWSNTTGAGLGNAEELYVYTATAISALTPTAFICGVTQGANTGLRPNGLTDNYTWTDFGTGRAYKYKTTGATYTGTPAVLLTAIGNPLNYDTAGTVSLVATDWTFSVTMAPPPTNPVITDVTKSIALPTSSDAVIISATITDETTVSSAELYWGLSLVTMTNVLSMSHSGDVYQQTIPAQASYATIYYYIRAVDNIAGETLSSTYNYVSYDIPPIVITEIHYNPAAAQGADADYEFFEVYNNSAEYQSLKDITVSQGIVFAFPDELISPYEYRLLAVKASSYSGMGYVVYQFTSGALNNTGEAIELTAYGRQIDIVNYSNLAPWPMAANGNGPSMELLDPSADNNDAANWIAATTNGTPGAARYEIPNSVPTLVDGQTITILTGIGLNYDQNWEPGAGTPITNINFVPVASFSLTGTGLFTFTVSTTPGNYGAYWQNGMWNEIGPAGLDGLLTFNINFDAKGMIPIILGSESPTLPVELSSFTAILTSESLVNLTWVTESETQALGFDVYRSTNPDISNSIRINASIIPATNTSEQHVYDWLDTEVESNNTYYYWLASVEMDASSETFGPVIATVLPDGEEITPPVEIAATSINSIFPNPFNPHTTIIYSMKSDTNVSLAVFNQKGQKVKILFDGQKTAGLHNVNWDGRDSNNQACASGTYYVVLKNSKTTSTRKIVMLK